LNDYAQKHNLFIHKTIDDVKNFYTEIDKTALLSRLDFFLSHYRTHQRTAFVSVPKYGKTPPPKPGADRQGRFYTFHVDMILAVVTMALKTAFFELGTVILLQILGLVMGDPLSPPLAQIFVSFDEYHHTLRNLTANTDIVRIYMKRYMDDLLTILLTRSRNSPSATRFFAALTNSLYEHDLSEKNFKLVRSKEGDKFLDSDVIIDSDHTSIKVIYHNKNSSVLYTASQTIGRFYDKCANTPHTSKLSGIVNILIRITRTTTFSQDMLICFHAVFTELLLLDYTLNDLHSAIHSAKNIQPHFVWDLIALHFDLVF
jgi:hypothetical protein